MMKFTIGLCLTAALLLGNLNTAEARGRRCSSCNQGGGIFQGRISHHQGSKSCNSCTGDTCQVCNQGVLTGQQTTITPTGIQPQQPGNIISQEPILVRGADGRQYYLVPESQYRQQK